MNTFEKLGKELDAALIAYEATVIPYKADKAAYEVIGKFCSDNAGASKAEWKAMNIDRRSAATVSDKSIIALVLAYQKMYDARKVLLISLEEEEVYCGESSLGK